MSINRLIKYAWKEFSISMTTIIMLACCNACIPLVYAKIITSLYNTEFKYAIILCLIQIFLCFFGAFVTNISNIYSVKFVSKLTDKIRSDLINRILDQEYTQFSKNSYNYYVSTMMNDVTRLSNQYFSSIQDYVSYISSLIGSLVLLTYFSLPIALLTLIASLFSIKASSKYENQINDLSIELSQADESLMLVVKEAIEGYEILKINNCIEYSKNEALERIKNREEKYKAYQEKQLKMIYFGMVSNDSMRNLINLLVIILIVLGHAEVGFLIAAKDYVEQVSFSLINSMTVRSVMKSTKSLQDKLLSIYTQDNDYNPDILPLSGLIQINNLSFSYENHQIFNNFSYTFKKNGKYAIIGPSGKGKTTLLKLLLGILTPTNGHIYIDGQDLSKYKLSSWFNQLAYIDQQAFIFTKSIRDNIILDNLYDEEHFKNVLKQSQLLEWIESLEMKENTICEEYGHNLSGGQKQRIAIARALYNNKKILLIDEGDSSLDSTTSLNIQKTLLQNPNLTVIFITHHIAEQTKLHLTDVLEL